MADATPSDETNGQYVEMVENSQDSDAYKAEGDYSESMEVTLFGLLNHFIAAVFFPGSDGAYVSVPLLQRIKASLSENVPLLREASRNSARNLLLWTRRGSPFRALLVVSVGTIALLALTGFVVFMLFFVAATANAIIISLLISLAAAGGFLALFFACVTAIYIGALSVAVFVISTATISAIIAAAIATGWIGFFWTVWLGTKKSVSLAKNSLTVTGSALSTYSSAWHARHLHESKNQSH